MKRERERERERGGLMRCTVKPALVTTCDILWVGGKVICLPPTAISLHHTTYVRADPTMSPLLVPNLFFYLPKEINLGVCNMARDTGRAGVP